MSLLATGESSEGVATLVESHGIDFEPLEPYLELLKEIAGADRVLLKALRAAKRVKPPGAVVDTVAMDSALAEQSDRISLELDPENAVTHFDLAFALMMQNRSADAIAELREALKLEPGFLYAHMALGHLLEGDEAAAEFRKALQLKPDFVYAHMGLGLALASKDDLDGAIAEYRAAVQVKPDEEAAHGGLGLVLAHKGNLDGAIGEYHEALRLNPEYSNAHYFLALALENKGERKAALEEYRTAYKLAPYNPRFRADYERLSRELQP